MSTSNDKPNTQINDAADRAQSTHSPSGAKDGKNERGPASGTQQARSATGQAAAAETATAPAATDSTTKGSSKSSTAKRTSKTSTAKTSAAKRRSTQTTTKRTATSASDTDPKVSSTKASSTKASSTKASSTKAATKAASTKTASRQKRTPTRKSTKAASTGASAKTTAATDSPTDATQSETATAPAATDSATKGTSKSSTPKRTSKTSTAKRRSTQTATTRTATSASDKSADTAASSSDTDPKAASTKAATKAASTMTTSRKARTPAKKSTKAANATKKSTATSTQATPANAETKAATATSPSKDKAADTAATTAASKDSTADTASTERATQHTDSSSSSHTTSTQDQDKSHDTPPDARDYFDLNRFAQPYLEQFAQLAQLNPFQFQSSELQSNESKSSESTSTQSGSQASESADPSFPIKDLFENSMKMWQESTEFFTQMLLPNSAPSAHTDRDGTASTAQGQRQNASLKSLEEQVFDQRLKDNPVELFGEVTQKVFGEALSRVSQSNSPSQSLVFDLVDGWMHFINSVTDKSPTALLEKQTQLWQQQIQLYQNTLMTMTGTAAEPTITPEKGDNRFKDDDWSSNPYFDYLKQSYLLAVDNIMQTIDNAKGVDDKTRQRLSFYTRQWLNAVAPSNFLWSNPEVLRLTQATNGQNLIKGLNQLAEDLEKSASLLSIRMTDDSAFKLGDNIASTPGKVVFRNRMFELIQYTPTTAKVHQRPLVIVPPWINKFYIMDLKEKNSYIRWALNEGHSVFILSWANPTRAYKDVGMETYMQEGLLTALDVVQEITGEPDANVIGYCIGGMLLALTLSWLTENDQAERIASATFWTTIFDFTDPGDLGVFIDERMVDALEQEEEKHGVFDGRMMGVAFSLLRENSLYWNYYVQNYLKGERPTPFDLLYWNSDCTNVTAALHSFLLRELYLGNKLIKPGELSFDGVNIDLSKVTTPTYIVATLQDHIAKWKGSYQGTQVLGGEVTFVLGESGHIAGIINPPTGKYGFYTHDDYPADPDAWFDQAIKHDKSWWLHWADWITAHQGDQVESRHPGRDHKGNAWSVLADAPGDYVRVKAEDALKAS